MVKARGGGERQRGVGVTLVKQRHKWSLYIILPSMWTENKTTFLQHLSLQGELWVIFIIFLYAGLNFLQ